MWKWLGDLAQARVRYFEYKKTEQAREMRSYAGSTYTREFSFSMTGGKQNRVRLARQRENEKGADRTALTRWLQKSGVAFSQKTILHCVCPY